MSKKTVAVLMGGWSAERDVSMSTGEAVATALEKVGYPVHRIDLKRDPQQLISALTPKPDVVFNALHGPIGEDGVIQGFLDMMNIPYTHSGVEASAIAMNKIQSRKIFEQDGIPTPPWKVISLESLKTSLPFEFPLVLKPIQEGSSKGVYMIHQPSDMDHFFKTWIYGNKVLAEKFIKGRDIQVAVIGDKAIGAIEICPKEAFYDYVAKYTPGRADHLMPAPLSEKAYEHVLDLALKAHKSLGCKGVTRSDFMYDEAANCFYLLEINTQPGMTPLSLVPEIAGHEGISFESLVSWMVENAQCGH